MGVGRIFLLRHGETQWSASGRHTGRTDIPLTRFGQEQARRAGALLGALRDSIAPALVLASPRERAVRTAELAGLVPDRLEPELAEWDYGAYEGATTSEIREQVPGWTLWTHPCPGGETAEGVADRADRLLASIAATLRGGAEGADAVLVGHGHFNRVLTARWVGLPATAGVDFALDAGAWTVLGHEREVPRLDHVNLPST